MKSPILHAVAFGKDGTDGDSTFYGSTFKCRKLVCLELIGRPHQAGKMSIFEQLTEDWQESEEYDIEDNRNTNTDFPVGFWILDDNGMKAVKAFKDTAMDESIHYSIKIIIIKILKGMIKELAIKTVKA